MSLHLEQAKDKYEALRLRLKEYSALGPTLDLREGQALLEKITLDLIEMNTFLERLDEKIDLFVVSRGYDTLVGDEGKVLMLTAGDHHWEDSKLVLNMYGWEMLDNPKEVTSESPFEDRWVRMSDATPVHYELCVTKTAGLAYDYDWFEPSGFLHYGHFAENKGPVQMWMYAKAFDQLAPSYIKDKIGPVTAEVTTQFELAKERSFKG